MMYSITSTTLGIVGSVLLVIGAALPVRVSKHLAIAPKNIFFALGNVCMIVYSIMRYFEGGSQLFILLQILIVVSTIMMLRGGDPRRNAPVIACLGAGFIVYTLYFFPTGWSLLFVVGLIILSLGFALPFASPHRQWCLAIGSIFIAWYSYLVSDLVFLWLNVFFAAFNAWHALRLGSKNHKTSILQ